MSNLIKPTCCEICLHRKDCEIQSIFIDELNGLEGFLDNKTFYITIDLVNCKEFKKDENYLEGVGKIFAYKTMSIKSNDMPYCIHHDEFNQRVWQPKSSIIDNSEKI